MARQIIIMERQVISFSLVQIRAAFWCTVTSLQALAKPNFTSAVVGGDAPSAPELAELRAGTTIELVFQWLFPSTYTNAELRTFFEKAYAAVQASVTADPPGIYYGATWDGGTWTP